MDPAPVPAMLVHSPSIAPCPPAPRAAATQAAAPAPPPHPPSGAPPPARPRPPGVGPPPARPPPPARGRRALVPRPPHPPPRRPVRGCGVALLRGRRLVLLLARLPGRLPLLPRRVRVDQRRAPDPHQRVPDLREPHAARLRGHLRAAGGDLLPRPGGGGDPPH